MRAREFAFWLQGYFELSGPSGSLTVKQANDILTKLQKVDTTGTDAVDQKAAAYANFAKGALDAIGYVLPQDQQAVLAGVTRKLRADLDNLFVHAIDPSIPGDQQQHRNKHRPDDDRPRIVAMC